MISKITYPLVSVAGLKSNSAHPKLIILDATINKHIENSSVRIPNARFFDIKKKFSDTSAPFPSTLPSQIQFESEARKLGVNNDSVIVVYDDKGIYSSARAWWLFKTFGFKNVAVLDGGLPEFQNKGFKVENYNAETYVEGNFEAKPNSGLTTDFEGINTYSNDTNTLIIDARATDRFNCLVDEPRVGLRRGTIPNSKNLPYTNLLNGNILKPKAELLSIISSVVEGKQKLVFSCGSGITACILALAASICDYKNLVIYDGSWTEYGDLVKN